MPFCPCLPVKRVSVHCIALSTANVPFTHFFIHATCSTHPGMRGRRSLWAWHDPGQTHSFIPACNHAVKRLQSHVNLVSSTSPRCSRFLITDSPLLTNARSSCCLPYLGNSCKPGASNECWPAKRWNALAAYALQSGTRSDSGGAAFVTTCTIATRITNNRKARLRRRLACALAYATATQLLQGHSKRHARTRSRGTTMFVHLCTAHSAVSIDQHVPQAHMRACGSCAWQRTSQSLKPAAFAAACKRVSVPKSCGRSSTSMPKSSAVCRNVGSSGAWGCSCNQRSHLLNAARALLSQRGACKLVALNLKC